MGTSYGCIYAIPQNNAIWPLVPTGALAFNQPRNVHAVRLVTNVNGGGMCCLITLECENAGGPSGPLFLCSAE